HEGIFGFYRVQSGSARGLNSDHVAEKPKQQVNGVNGLIDQGTSAVEQQRAAPMRVGVITGRSKPLHASVGQDRFTQHAVVDPLLNTEQVGFETVLKKDSQLHP